MFYGNSYIYAGISSENFDLRIQNFESGGTGDSPAGSESALIQKYIVKRTTPFYYGRTQNVPIEVTLSVGAQNPIPGVQRSAIEKWMLGSMNYQKLAIVQDDIQNLYWNIIFNRATAKYVGNLHFGYIFSGQANAPWAFEYPQTLTKTYTGSAVVSETFNFYNSSDDNSYLFPTIEFTTSGMGSGLTVTNNTDNARQFSFTNILSNETISADCSLQTITSSTGLLRMSKFNKQFFRLVPGNNSISLSGGITSFKMTYDFARAVGV